MNTRTNIQLAFLGVLISAPVLPALAQDLIINGGFESGFAGWTRVDQIGSEGTFHLQSGVSSPVNAFGVVAPPEGVNAAMTDSVGPGSHVLYQDFLVPVLVPGATLQFSIFINNGAAAFSTPNSLDFATTALNQQVRVDILAGGSDPFSTAAGDVLFTAFQSAAADPLVSGYTTFTLDVTALLAARTGQTLRLRFAEVDNVNFFNLGVDAVSLTIPAPSALALLGIGAVALRRRR